jgi:hypothetical protein
MIPGTLIRTDADLCRLWQDMMGSGGFARRSIWMIFLDNECRVQPLVVPIDDIPAEPEPELLRGLGTTLDGVIDGENASSVALLLSRPGPSRASEQDGAGLELSIRSSARDSRAGPYTSRPATAFRFLRRTTCWSGRCRAVDSKPSENITNR